MRACQDCLWASPMAGSPTGSATFRSRSAGVACDEPGVKVCDRSDRLALLADAVVLRKVSGERERGAGYVVKGGECRVLGAGGDDVEDDVGAGAGSGRKEVVADQGVEVVGRDVALGDYLLSPAPRSRANVILHVVTS